MAESVPAGAAQIAENAYDAVPYRDYPYSFSHVRHLETMATLFGMAPADIHGCRVLELGCAAGGNLIPQAVDLPDSRFLGVDLSERQIVDGQKLLGELQLPNTELRQANILDIDESWGKFDYIIAHGVFSWVPAEVQEKLLEICARNLAPQGVAFVSYNTFPGWRLGGVVRDLMQFHAGGFANPLDRITQAKAILEFLVSLETGGVMGQLLKEELESLRKVNNDTYLFHEHLEDENNPVYFHQFMALAQARGLQYLADADFTTMLMQNAPSRVRDTFRALPLIQQEQYLDFIRGRRFRKSMLCHNNLALERNIRPDMITKFHFAIDGKCECDSIDIRSETPSEFRRNGAKLTTSQRIVKAAAMYLKEVSPRFVAFRDLYLAAYARVQSSRPVEPSNPAVSRQTLAEAMLTGFSVGMFDICLHPPVWMPQVSAQPVASPLARLQAARGQTLTNRYHRSIALNSVCQRVILRLDGRHDQASLIPCVAEAVSAGELVVKRRDEPLKDVPPEAMKDVLDQTLRQIAEAGLLVK